MVSAFVRPDWHCVSLGISVARLVLLRFLFGVNICLIFYC